VVVDVARALVDRAQDIGAVPHELSRRPTAGERVPVEAVAHVAHRATHAGAVDLAGGVDQAVERVVLVAGHAGHRVTVQVVGLRDGLEVAGSVVGHGLAAVLQHHVRPVAGSRAALLPLDLRDRDIGDLVAGVGDLGA